MKVERDVFMDQLRKYIKDDTSDEAISIIENFNDSFHNDDVEAIKKELEDMRIKYDEDIKEWKEKYKERFFNPPPTNETESVNGTNTENSAEKITFDDIFKEE